MTRSMFRKPLNLAVFLVGLAAVGWIATGYAASNPLALSVALLIGACYLAGGFELHRYRQATATLEQAVDELSAPPARLGDWLDRLHPSLRNAVRLRVEGARVALPGPALTPYLVGLLVLLGMLGTLLGMMATLRGTGIALESATDLQAIRASLAAPVKGLGFAFGTSIAGVTTSAMLGLLSTLCRRERQQAAQRLDLQIATTLRIHSQAHQRDETFKLLQRQTELMPALVERLQAMTTALEQQGLATSERQLASQEAFHGRSEAAYARLASSLEQSLKDSVAESARAAGAALQPVAEATMAALARQASALHDSVAQATQRQMEGLSAGFETSAATVAGLWQQALDGHRQTSEALARDLHGTLDRFTATFEQRSAGLLEDVSTRLGATTGNMADAWQQALARQQDLNGKLAAQHQQAWAAAASSFEQQAAALLRGVDQSHAELQATLASQDQQRLAAWAETLGSMTTTLRAEWEQAGEHAASRQQAICDTLAHTAHDITTQAQAQAAATIAEIARLVQAAAEAPRAAADVVAELRQKLSDSMARDTAMLEERNRLMTTLETLLGTVSHAATEQRAAVDALVATSADLLDRLGSRFGERIEAEAGKLDTATAHVTAGAAEVASLGEAFGSIVQQFGKSSDKLVARLQKVEGALDKSLARSDEQLAYYVAQAREVIDLSVLSQRQIIEELQRLAGRQAPAGTEAA
ncbi:MAG: DUF802 domain-containing protein [Pseudomonas sp.]